MNKGNIFGVKTTFWFVKYIITHYNFGHQVKVYIKDSTIEIFRCMLIEG